MKYSLIPFEKEFIQKYNLKNEVVVIDANQLFKNPEFFDALNKDKYGKSDRGLFVTVVVDDQPFHGIVFQKDPAVSAKNIKIQISSSYYEEIPVDDYIAIFELDLFKRLKIEVESGPLAKESFICYFANDIKIQDYNYTSKEITIITNLPDEDEMEDVVNEDEEFFDDTTDWEDSDEDFDEIDEDDTDDIADENSGYEE